MFARSAEDALEAALETAGSASAPIAIAPVSARSRRTWFLSAARTRE
jgi:hypothetical protein